MTTSKSKRVLSHPQRGETLNYSDSSDTLVDISRPIEIMSLSLHDPYEHLDLMD